MQNNKKQAKKTDDKVANLEAAEVIKNAAEVVEAKPVKKSVKKAATTKTTAKKPEVKATAEKNTSTRKTIKTSIFIQHDGKEVEDKDIIAKVKEIWVSELGNRIGEMKSIITYIKPEEQSVYYVVNDDVTGRFDF